MMIPSSFGEEARAQAQTLKRRNRFIRRVAVAILAGLAVWACIYSFRDMSSGDRKVHDPANKFSWTSTQTAESEDAPSGNFPRSWLLPEIFRSPVSYDGSCSYEAESTRKEYIRRAMFSWSKETFLMPREQNLKECSQSKLLVCAKETETCVCGNIIQEVLQGPRRSLYIYEDRNCRQNTGAFCLPKEIPVAYEIKEMRMGVFPGRVLKEVVLDSTCRRETACRLANGGGNCTLQAILRDERLANDLFNRSDNDNINFQKLMSGSICTCQA